MNLDDLSDEFKAMQNKTAAMLANQKKLEHILKIPVSIPLSEGVDEIVELIKKEYLLEQ